MSLSNQCCYTSDLIKLFVLVLFKEYVQMLTQQTLTKTIENGNKKMKRIFPLNNAMSFYVIYILVSWLLVCISSLYNQ